MDDLPSPLDISSDELTWLHASEILGEPPAPPPKDDDVFMEDVSFSTSESFSFSPHNIRCTTTTSTPIFESPASSKRAASLCSTPPRGSTRLNDSPRSEWIYRRPRSPLNGRHRSAEPGMYSRALAGCVERPPILLTRSTSSATTLTSRVSPMASFKGSLDQDPPSALSSTPGGSPFWSTVLRPRPRSERSIPLLKTIPSESQIVLTPLDMSSPSIISTPKKISAPQSMSARPPSISSSLSSISNSPSPSSSRSESPVTPISLSSSPYSGTGAKQHRRQSLSPYYRRHRTHPDSDSNLPPLSHSCPPSKSILTRTSSVSTKDSTHTVNKSVKFAAIPTIHYASKGYWEMETYADDDRDGDMGINIDTMDVDDSFEEPYQHRQRRLRIDGRAGANHHNQFYHNKPDDDNDKLLDILKLRELQCTTPTPEREKEKARGLKRLMSLSRKPGPGASTTGTSTNVALAHKLPVPPSSPSPSQSNFQSHSPSPSPSPRPIISTPYPLGAFPGAQPMQSSASLRTRSRRRADYPAAAAGSVLDLPFSSGAAAVGRGNTPLRTAPSCESFRSSKSAAARSVRSLGSVKSTSSTRGFRAWLGRTVGWTES